MNRFVFILAIIGLLSCMACSNESSDKPEKENGIIAKKMCWTVVSTKADEAEMAGEEDQRDTIGINDVPWEDGEKVLLLGSDQTFEDCEAHFRTYRDTMFPYKTTLCTVYKSDGMKCALIPDTPLEEGTYRAFFPVYDFAYYDRIHFSFLYDFDGNVTDPQKDMVKHQDVVVSDPFTYSKDADSLNIVLNHICALIDISIIPPETSNYTYLKLFAQNTVLGGKVTYGFDENQYNVEGWSNYVSLRGNSRYMEKEVVFPTSTALLPVQYNGLPMNILIVYEDGTRYVSEAFAMPSLNLGVENRLVVKDFHKTEEVLQGLSGNSYDDPAPDDSYRY